MYVYLKSEPALWTVGFYDPAGAWHAESDHDSPQAAAARVAYLNGDRQADYQPLIEAAQAVIARWETGDLAAAVRDLAAALKSIDV